MIPLRLTLKNFLSYGTPAQTVDFAPYHLICLSGKNGHGKSALLDALTWATWGQARKTGGTAKPDVGLIRLGQSSATVIYEFICAGQQYRIRRECTIHYGKTYTTLEFAVHDTAGDTYLPLTEKTIRKTQEKIEQTLRLDYHSFCNSSFLRQGNANEFSTKSPRERKQIISTILGIDHYETLRKSAQQQHRQHSTELLALRTVLEQLHARQTDETALAKEITILGQQSQQCKMDNDKLRRTYKIIRKQLSRLHSHTAHISGRIHTEQNKQKQYEQLQQQLRSMKQEWKGGQKALTSVKAHQKLKRTESTLEQQLEQLIAQKTAQSKLEKNRTTITQQLLVAREQQTQQRIQRLQVIQQSLATTQAELTLKQSELQTAQKEQQYTHIQQQKQKTKLTTLTQQIAQKEIQLSQHKKTAQIIGQYTGRLERFEQTRTALIRRAKTVQTNNNQITENTLQQCPVCLQTISQEQKQQVLKRFTREQRLILHQIARLTKLCPLLQKQHTRSSTTQAEVEKTQQELSQLMAERTTFLQLRQDSDVHIKKIHLQIIDCTHAITSLEQNKQQQDIEYGAAQRCKDTATLTKLTEEKQAIETHLQKLTNRLNELPKLQQQLYTIRKEIDAHAPTTIRALQKGRQQQIRQCIAQMRALMYHPTTITNLTKRHNTLIASTTATAQYLEQIEQELEATGTQLRQYAIQKERLLAQCEVIEQTKREIQALQKKVEYVTIQINDYAAISTALSKDGIQALLIEEALPEIEREANGILAQLTDNQTQIIIESLRDLKKGGSRETLEINISDEQGIRSYELFSGGEAFRIDFALRIAISKLLAIRSGTSLETLIIDEGFGSQDPQGLSFVMDTLYKIQDTFAKIIIVSHLTELQNQFPVHFMVHKDSTGSKVSVRENG